MRCCTFVLAPLTFLAIFIASLFTDGGSAYTGAGGHAIGGSTNDNGISGLTDDVDTLNFDSGDAAHGGKATRGSSC